ncbi:hypothetical protein CY34DRAFT_811291 [Suillus luteus UH-Slu-Lm8-n1]|uniref:Uncharacterized protein n=1 Tax=Suillus luteus UH-Slu-Lm8-n1 TaxID=930992 RepID=A0A0D0AE30_9AGAM|nr:hypothetical protein CY34DRAFT_811291 [Suillus luteus UH-Slu-Lm8-n1]
MSSNTDTQSWRQSSSSSAFVFVTSVFESVLASLELVSNILSRSLRSSFLQLI